MTSIIKSLNFVHKRQFKGRPMLMDSRGDHLHPIDQERTTILELGITGTFKFNTFQKAAKTSKYNKI